MAGIAHLHVHSHLSLLGGTASPEELVARAAAFEHRLAAVVAEERLDALAPN